MKALVNAGDIFDQIDIIKCTKHKYKKSCLEIIRTLEIMQNYSMNVGSYRCQTSLLGLQSEILANYESKNNEELKILRIVIDNCNDLIQF